jgi:putative toxin-antitoxin system antitoxin component (TIGR02293 family)
METKPKLSPGNVKDHVKMAALAVQGLSPEVALDLAGRLGVSQERLSELAQIAKTTLHRRMKEHQTLAQDESERVIRLFGLYQRAVEVFDDEERATKWFSSHPKALGGKTPLEFMETEPGSRYVEKLLGRIEQGVFS